MRSEVVLAFRGRFTGSASTGEACLHLASAAHGVCGPRCTHLAGFSIECDPSPGYLRRMASGFKEWQVVCDALASGRQSIILRKGGIHEGRAGFSFAEENFFLFPTRFHNQDQFVREGSVVAKPEWTAGEIVTISHYAEALWAKTLTDWDQVAALESLHIWTEETIRQRFDWEGKGMASGSIHVALVRISELAQSWEFSYEAKYGGCRSWVTLPEPPEGAVANAKPLLGDDVFSTLFAKLEEILG